MRAVLVFVEGQHDVVFVTRSLGAAGGRWKKGPIRNLPSPFGSVHDPKSPGKPIQKSAIAMHYQRRSLEDLHIRAAAHSSPPTFESMVELGGVLYVIIRSNGDRASSQVERLYRDIESMLLPGFTEIDELAMAFVFDADNSLSSREASFYNEYSWCVSLELEHCGWKIGPCGPVGLFIFHDPATQTGTLEDIIAPLTAAQWPDRWSGAGRYLDAHASPTDPVSHKPAEKLKAQINITGQFLLPGDPMSQVISRRGLKKGLFQRGVSKELIDFLRAAPEPSSS